RLDLVAGASAVVIQLDAVGRYHQAGRVADRRCAGPFDQNVAGRRGEATAAAVQLTGKQVVAADELGDEAVGRSPVEFLRRGDLLDASAVHHHHAVGHGKGLGLAVGDVDEGDVEFPVQAHRFGMRENTQVRVTRREGFAEPQHLRRVGQGPGQCNALPLTDGQLVYAASGEGQNTHALHPFLGLAYSTDAGVTALPEAELHV